LITLKSKRELDRIRSACGIVAEALELARSLAKAGVSTGYLDKAVEKLIIDRGAEPAFKGHGASGKRPPYPASICASVNDAVVHGIPDERELREGDLLSVDVGVRCRRYYGDGAATFAIGQASPRARHLMEICQQALELAIRAAGPGKPLSAISRAVESHVKANGFSVVRDLVGHGVGTSLWEEPQVPNFYNPSFPDVVLQPGMVLAVEPMINEGGWRVRTLANRWTVVTADGSLSAHFEHTVAITRDGVEVLTVPPGQKG